MNTPTAKAPKANAPLPAKRIAEIRKDPPMLMTIQEAAAFLSVSSRAVYKLVRSGQLRGTKAGRGIRISLSTIRKVYDV